MDSGTPPAHPTRGRAVLADSVPQKAAQARDAAPVRVSPVRKGDASLASQSAASGRSMLLAHKLLPRPQAQRFDSAEFYRVRGQLSLAPDAPAEMGGGGMDSVSLPLARDAVGEAGAHGDAGAARGDASPSPPSPLNARPRTSTPRGSEADTTPRGAVSPRMTELQHRLRMRRQSQGRMAPRTHQAAAAAAAAATDPAEAAAVGTSAPATVTATATATPGDRYGGAATGRVALLRHRLLGRSRFDSGEFYAGSGLERELAALARVSGATVPTEATGAAGARSGPEVGDSDRSTDAESKGVDAEHDADGKDGDSESEDERPEDRPAPPSEAAPAQQQQQYSNAVAGRRMLLKHSLQRRHVSRFDSADYFQAAMQARQAEQPGEGAEGKQDGDDAHNAHGAQAQPVPQYAAAAGAATGAAGGVRTSPLSSRTDFAPEAAGAARTLPESGQRYGSAAAGRRAMLQQRLSHARQRFDSADHFAAQLPTRFDRAGASAADRGK